MPSPAAASSFAKGAHRLARFARNLVFFGCGLLGAGQVLPTSGSLPAMDQIAPKLQFLAESSLAPSVLFFGSSKIYGGFIPTVFDEKLRKQGHAVQSFNLGFDGMSFPESVYFCEKLLARGALKPRYVLVELTPLRKRIPPVHRNTLRARYWHDFKRTWLCWRALVSDAPTWAAFTSPQPELLGDTPAQVTREHAKLFVHRLFSVSDGAPLLTSRLGLPEETRWKPTDLGRNHPDPSLLGYYPTHRPMPKAEQPAYERDLAVHENTTPGEPDLVAEAEYRELGRRIAATGAKMILVVFPNSLPNRRIFVAGRAPEGVPVLAFDNPRAYPQLYPPEVRADAVHLNDAGAKVFTRLLAERFAEILERDRAASN